jgi:hypothetical protein
MFTRSTVGLSTGALLHGLISSVPRRIMHKVGSVGLS